MESNGDACPSPVRTRGQWRRDGKITLDEYEKLVKYENNGANDETKELIQDQIFHSFVEVISLFTRLSVVLLLNY